MRLKTRLRLSIVALVGTITLVLSVLYLRGLAQSEFEHVRDRAVVAGQQVQTFLLQLIRSYRPDEAIEPGQIEEAWSGMVSENALLPEFLVATMANSKGVVDILVTGSNGRILAASNPLRQGRGAVRLESFLEWDQQSTWNKLRAVLSSGQNYEVIVPLGIGNRPLFDVRVIVSTVLVRNAVLPQVERLALVSLGCLLLAMLAGVIFSNIAFRPVVKIGQAIDRIAAGEAARDAASETPADRELATVQAKLDMLGQQFRGAKEDATQLRGNVEQMLQNLDDAVLLFDNSHRLMLAGSAAERFLGVGRWELLGRTLDDVFSPETTVGALVQAAVQLRRPIRDHLVALDDTSSEMRVLVSVELLEDFKTHNQIGTMVTIRDAETRLKIESQLQVSQRLAAIGRLTGGVAHEIKNPLNAISVHLEILRSKLAGSGVSDDIDSIAVIGRELSRLDRVVKTFLDFTKPVELHMAEVDLVPLVRDLNSLVSPHAKRQKVTVDLTCALDQAVVHGDRDLLSQAVLNVAMNGLEAMPGGGRLAIQLSQPDDTYVLTLTDQGGGIPPEVRNKIFNLYFTTKERGSGIGLAATFRIVQLHNATIDFVSEVGQGTTFTFRFPAAPRTPLDRVAQTAHLA